MQKIAFCLLFILWFTTAQAGAQRVENVEFESHGVNLAGSIVFPQAGSVRAGVVFVHGSGPQTRNTHWAERFAEAGIAALVYDKRGVGESGGEYESNQSVSGPNIRLLADDAAAAVTHLANHPRLRDVPVGLSGISQAGWIVPLAAESAPGVAFIALWSGPVCKVSEEDIYSKYTGDKDEAEVPAYREALEARKMPYIWPDFLGVDSSPTDSLKKLSIPGLWVFGRQDGSIPVDLSIERLEHLIGDGHAFEYVLFSALGHNNMPETFATVSDWIVRVSAR